MRILNNDTGESFYVPPFPPNSSVLPPSHRRTNSPGKGKDEVSSATSISALAPPFGNGRPLCCEDLNSCCDGGVPTSLPMATWNHIRAFADTFHVRELLDSTPRMLERHYTFYNLMTKNPHGWDTLFEDEILQLTTGKVAGRRTSSRSCL